MNRYQIDDFPASGPNALLLLAVVAQLRMRRGERVGLDELIDELYRSAKSAKTIPLGEEAPKTAPKKPIHFGDYFKPSPHPQHFKHASNSLVYLAFRWFVAGELATVEGFSHPDAYKLVDDVVKESNFRAATNVIAEAGIQLTPDPLCVGQSGEQMTLAALSDQSLRLHMFGISPELVKNHP